MVYHYKVSHKDGQFPIHRFILKEKKILLPSNDDLFSFVLRWHWSWCGKLASLLIILPLLSRHRLSRTLQKSPLEPTAVSLFGNMIGKMRNTHEHQKVSIRQQDPNNYSYTEKIPLEPTAA